MPSLSDIPVVERIHKLGLTCADAPTGEISSAVAALACFPMYMVANVHAWTDDSEFRIPIVDLRGSETIREAYALGQQEAKLQVSDEHRKVLGDLLAHAKPSDRIIYEYALDTLQAYLSQASPSVAESLRAAIGRGIVAVAEASGKGFLGMGRKVSPEERTCIAEISGRLGLTASPEAAAALQSLGT